MSDLGAVWTPAASGNYDASRAAVVDLIIDHHTASTLQAAIARFTQAGSQVSAHFIVDRDGTRYYLVSVAHTAYHSGNYGINQRSIGIEHVSLGPNGEVDAFTDIQYASSEGLHRELAAYFEFPLDPAHVWPHHQVVATDCPGNLDLNRLIGGADIVPALTDDHPDFQALIWRVEAILQNRPAVLNGPTAGEPNLLHVALAQSGGHPPAQLTVTGTFTGTAQP